MEIIMEEIMFSSLGKVWLLDLDGTIVKHNGYKIDGYDTLLEGAKEFLGSIDEKDMIIFITSRTDDYKMMTIKFLEDNNIRYHQIIFNAPYGERIVINDRKPSGLDTAIAINSERDKFCETEFHIDERL